MKLPLLGLVVSSAATVAPAQALPPPPAFPPGDTADVIQGVRVADPYRALEDGADPKWRRGATLRTRGHGNTSTMFQTAPRWRPS